jgi:hypothetical protein
VLRQASDVVAISKRDAGGDNLVPRDHHDRPLIKKRCFKCEGSGRLPSEKKPPPATVQCGRCRGVGWKEEPHTRTTTFIDVLEDKSNLMAWKGRMTLVGAAIDPKFLDGVTDLDPENSKADKDMLNRLAESAQTVAGASVKAEKGTHLHGLSELVDEGVELPDGISFGDVIDMDAYRRETALFRIKHMERLVVNAQYKVAGTPDRVSTFDGSALLSMLLDGTLVSEHLAVVDGVVHLVAPDGTLIGPDELLITDLKTGSVEYGGLKMAMQLAIYANSELYDHEAENPEDALTPLGNINRKWGIIMHLPAGQGVCTLYWADLTLGWEAVDIASKVRDLRRRGKKALTTATVTA